MNQLALNTRESPHSCPIYIGSDLLTSIGKLLLYPEKALTNTTQELVIISTPRLAPLYLATLQNGLHAVGLSTRYLEIPDGETHKNWDTLHRILNQLLTWQLDRQSVLLALGGGYVSDLVGLAASLYQRGIRWVACPTTLLAQVDAAIGGKTAINHALGKNLIGTFWQPSAVISDLSTLNTLPEREFRAGLAEAFKYGLIRDLPFWEWGETALTAILAREPSALVTLITTACQHKIDLVSQDITDQQQRRLLNLGHTFGHAIEAGLNYSDWLHGEAVAAGIVLAARLSQKMGWLEAMDVERICALWRRIGLPIEAPVFGADRYLALMAADKKHSGGKLTFILLRQLGQAAVVDNVPEEWLLALFNDTL